MELSLQDTYAPKGICFGCGSTNIKGLQIKSFVKGDIIIADWQAQKYHEAFPGILNGGIIGALLDCHCNWAGAYYMMKHHHLDKPPCTVTAYYNISLKRPTPSEQPVHLIAKLKEIKKDRAYIEGDLYSGDQLCASCEGLFVAVKEDHPAYHRW